MAFFQVLASCQNPKLHRSMMPSEWFQWCYVRFPGFDKLHLEIQYRVKCGLLLPAEYRHCHRV